GTLGKLIFCNLPDSLDWQVDLYTLEDCEQIVTSYFQSDDFTSPPSLRSEWLREYCHIAKRPKSEQYYNFASNVGTDYVSDAEAALIWYWKPCCNIVFNSNRPPYPPTIQNPKQYFQRFLEPTDARLFLSRQLTKWTAKKKVRETV